MSPWEFLADHTYRMVLLGTMVIGGTAGAVGCFAYLRRQALLADVVSHSALPGSLAAFLLAASLWHADGRSLLVLLCGAILTGLAAVAATNVVTAHTPLGAGTAMAIVLAAFFGTGMLLLRVITDGPYPGKGGVEGYLFGNASVLTTSDLAIATATALLALLPMILLWKQFVLRTFDPATATLVGVPPRLVDALMLGSFAVATVNGVKAVGLVLMVAFVVTPPAIARQWCARLRGMVVLAGVLGAASAATGAYLSILWGGLPTGPVIVLVLAAVFAVSLLVAPGRGLVATWLGRVRLRREIRGRVGEFAVAAPRAEEVPR